MFRCWKLKRQYKTKEQRSHIFNIEKTQTYKLAATSSFNHALTGRGAGRTLMTTEAIIHWPWIFSVVISVLHSPSINLYFLNVVCSLCMYCLFNFRHVYTMAFSRLILYTIATMWIWHQIVSKPGRRWSYKTIVIWKSYQFRRNLQY